MNFLEDTRCELQNAIQEMQRWQKQLQEIYNLLEFYQEVLNETQEIRDIFHFAQSIELARKESLRIHQGESFYNVSRDGWVQRFTK